MLSSTTCLMIVALMPFVWTAAVKGTGKYDNHNPRQYLANLQGWRARAQATHLNSWEALAMLTAALAADWHVNAPAAQVDKFATIFVAMRVLHGLFYLFNFAALRSLVWLVSFGCMIKLFLVALAAA
jgi:uncharacterized MAPEG superfamily protein